MILLASLLSISLNFCCSLIVASLLALALQPAYHSAFNEAKDAAQICGMAVLPLKTRIRGPAPQLDGGAEDDQVDEALRLFRANVLFRNFEVLGPADRTLIYLTLFIHQVRRDVRFCDGGR